MAQGDDSGVAVGKIPLQSLQQLQASAACLSVTSIDRTKSCTFSVSHSSTIGGTHWPDESGGYSRLQKPGTEGGGAEHGERRDADEAGQRDCRRPALCHQPQWGKLNRTQRLVAGAEMESRPFVLVLLGGH